MKVLIGIAVLAATVIATALLLKTPSSEGSPVSADRTAKRAVRTAKCIRATPLLRARIVNRRLATWRWQDEVYVPRTRSAGRERTAVGCAYLRWIRSLWNQRADEAWRFFVELRDDPDAAIEHFFGSYAQEAKNVVECESGDRDGDLSGEALVATNGQYLGMFQMGLFARSTYGHGRTALAQALAAHRYFVASGRDWSPWGCQPY